MIKLLLVTNPEKLNSDFKPTYESLFSPDERREWNQLLNLLCNSHFKLHEIYLQEKFIGFVLVWDLGEFSFIEHFAICAEYQGKGYGTEALNQLISIAVKPFILEVEEPSTEPAKKRIAFYERVNFFVNAVSYFQPPYSREKKSIKMLLMSYPLKIEPTDFERIKTHIHHQVYKYGSEIPNFE